MVPKLDKNILGLFFCHARFLHIPLKWRLYAKIRLTNRSGIWSSTSNSGGSSILSSKKFTKSSVKISVKRGRKRKYTHKVLIDKTWPFQAPSLQETISRYSGKGTNVNMLHYFYHQFNILAYISSWNYLVTIL